MSYSIRAKAATAAAALSSIATQFDQVVAGQPPHAADKDMVNAAAKAATDVLGPDDDETDIEVVVSGSLAGHWSGAQITKLSGVNMNVGAHRSKRDPADTGSPRTA
jgi:hypothetical protein